MEFDGEIVKFNIYGAISHRSEILNVNRVDIIDSLVEETFDSLYEDKLETLFDDNFDSISICESVNKLSAPMNTKLLPSVVQASDLELKPLPEHLKGTFLENDETIFDLEGTSPLICTNKIFLEENTKPKQEGQRRIEGTKN